MEKIIVNVKEFQPFIPAAEIQQAVSAMAKRINDELEGQNPLFVVVLNGAFMFAADLIRNITTGCEIAFVKLSSYSGTETTQVVTEILGLDIPVKDRTIVIVEDIIDTGITMGVLIEKMKALEARIVHIATFLFKPDAFRMNFRIDYIGMEIPNDFIIGYGLDYNGKGRNFAGIYKIVQ
jgi:hypoxanthine phosphoribosyltransferase